MGAVSGIIESDYTCVSIDLQHVANGGTESVVDKAVVCVAPEFNEGGYGSVICGQREHPLDQIPEGRIFDTGKIKGAITIRNVTSYRGARMRQILHPSDYRLQERDRDDM